MITPAEAAARADELVHAMYREFPTDSLREIADIGKKYEAVAAKEGKIIVLAMNTALQREIDRRERAAS